MQWAGSGRRVFGIAVAVAALIGAGAGSCAVAAGGGSGGAGAADAQPGRPATALHVHPAEIATAETRARSASTASAGAGPATSRSRAPVSRPSLPFREAWVAVPVATVWNHPATARPEDAAAVSARPDVGAWLAALDYHQKLGLDDLLATQALLDDPVLVYGHQGGWDHVLVLGQTGAVFPFGIAGWVPDSQLAYTAPPAGLAQGTVDIPLLAVGGMTLSYGTHLPITSKAGDRLTVALPDGRFSVPASAVRTGLLLGSGPAVVAQAERFLGLPYLWAGMSGFGFDCSGLTYSVYRQFGIVLARDAADQAEGGRPVARQDLQPGDLVFYAFGGPIDHVGIYAGRGMMVDSPRTGASIEVVPMWGTSLSAYYAGARRYL